MGRALGSAIEPSESTASAPTKELRAVTSAKDGTAATKECSAEVGSGSKNRSADDPEAAKGECDPEECPAAAQFG